MEEILIPIFICVVLPVSIVLIVSLARINTDNKRTQVLIKAIEYDNGVNADKLADALKKPEKPKKTELELLNLRLLRGCIFSLVGIAVVCPLFWFYNLEKSVQLQLLLVGLSLFAVGLSYLIVYFVTRKQTICSTETNK